MNNLKKWCLAFFVISLGLLFGCKNDDGVEDPCEDLGKVGGLIDDLLFPVSNDPDLGLQVSLKVDSIYANQILPESGNEEAYAYLNSIKNSLLSSEDVLYAEDFEWKLTIIQDDVLNAFATPGGYIYVYTGLINYLDNVDDLAGVMGHEIAHADRRHSVEQLKQNYGVAILASILTGGESSAAVDIAVGLATNVAALSFSRDDESEADAASVEYLDETQFACNGTAEFFRKLEEESSGPNIPEFLSTHPSPENRVTAIDARAECRGCSTEQFSGEINGMTYADFKALFD